jgi:hypothetical protein
MPHSLFQPTNGQALNAIIYADYENIHNLLKAYGRDPLKIDFFNIIQEKLTAASLNIIDLIVYGNFDKYLTGKQQSFLRSSGLQTRHITGAGTGSLLLELTVAALTNLFENPNLQVYVMITNAPDIISLLKVIKYQNRLSYLVTTQNGFNAVAAQCADTHAYLEDLFELTPPEIANTNPLEMLIKVDADTVSLVDMGRASEVARYFYKSHIRERASVLGKSVNLKGYLEVIARVVNRHPDEILDDFKLAHCLKYVTIGKYKEKKHMRLREKRLILPRKF